MPDPTRQPTPEQLWARGRDHEERGDLDAAANDYTSILRDAPGHIPALLRLSRFAQARNDYTLAHRHALAAADACRLSGDTRLLPYVTLRLLDFAEESELASVVLSSDWAKPDVLRQSPSLVQHLWLAGRYDDALRLLDAVEPRLPAHPLLAFSRGQIQQFLGRLDDAEAGYERALQLDPHLADAHWALAKLRPRGDGTRLERIGRTLARAGVHPGTRAQLLYALFHELDAVDARAPAWAALAEAAALMAAAAAPAPHAPAIRLMASDWQPAPHAPPGGLGQPRPTFILGLPRSGTTLLDRMLGNHGWVTSVGERNDLRAAVNETSGRFDGVPLLDAAALEAFDAERVGLRYRQRLRRAAPATALAIDKHPQNLYAIPTILAALPDARILCVTRAPMDLAFSNFKELFQGGAYGYSYAFAPLAAEVLHATRWMQHWAARAPHAVRVVSYESLVATPEASVQALLGFLDLPPWPELSRIERNTAPVTTASSVQVRHPVSSAALGAWQRYAAPLAPLHELLATEHGA